jgi:hypothetical protein
MSVSDSTPCDNIDLKIHSLDDNKWELIFDFTKDESGQKLNFSLLDPSQFQIVSKSIEGVD